MTLNTKTESSTERDKEVRAAARRTFVKLTRGAHVRPSDARLLAEWVRDHTEPVGD